MGRLLLKPWQLLIVSASTLLLIGAFVVFQKELDRLEVKVQPLGNIQMPPARDVTPLAEKIAAFPPEKDRTTDFIVGGKNPTALIRELPEIAGVPVAELERRMRPVEGDFLGNKESLLEVMAAHNQLVEELGVSHQELAKHLKVMARIHQRSRPVGVLYHGRLYAVTSQYLFDAWGSPFSDGLWSGLIVLKVENRTNGRSIQFLILMPDLIERYGFYGGREGTFRVDPRDIVEVFDFLKKR